MSIALNIATKVKLNPALPLKQQTELWKKYERIKVDTDCVFTGSIFRFDIPFRVLPAVQND